MFFCRIGAECEEQSDEGEIFEGYECNYTDGDYNFVSRRALKGTILSCKFADATLREATNEVIYMRLNSGAELPAVSKRSMVS